MTHEQQHALVIGLTGGFGGAVARALRARGWKITALMRDPSRRPDDLPDVEVVQGDAGDAELVSRLGARVELVVYGANVPYTRWRVDALPLLEPTAAAAERHGVRILFPGNIYNFAADAGPQLDETTPQEPTTAKGRVRVEMERRLHQAAERGARVLVLRCGDFFGEAAPSSWMNEIIKVGKAGSWRFTHMGPDDVPHAFAFLPDVGEAAARLVELPGDQSAFEVFHFSGHQVSFGQLRAALTACVGEAAVSDRSMPWLMMTLASPFVPIARELREMRYLWGQELALDDAKLRAALGELPQTPLQDALTRTLGLDDVGGTA